MLYRIWVSHKDCCVLQFQLAHTYVWGIYARTLFPILTCEMKRLACPIGIILSSKCLVCPSVILAAGEGWERKEICTKGWGRGQKEEEEGWSQPSTLTLNKTWLVK